VKERKTGGGRGEITRIGNQKIGNRQWGGGKKSQAGLGGGTSLVLGYPAKNTEKTEGQHSGLNNRKKGEDKKKNTGNSERGKGERGKG